MGSCPQVISEVAVPIVTNYADTPIMTIVLQILHDKQKVKDKHEEKKELIKEEMTSAWRVITFFIVVFVLPTIMISVPLYARYHIYHARSQMFTDGDMVSFHKDVSSFWCQGQRLISNGSFDAYLIKETVRAKKKRISNLSSNLLLMHDDVEEWGVHLIQGSHFTFSACSRWPGGTLLVVQGEENMRRCFYSEDRIKEELRNNEKKTLKPPPPKIEQRRVLDELGDALGGGEILADDEDLSRHEIIRKLYSSSRKSDEQDVITEKPEATYSSNAPEDITLINKKLNKKAKQKSAKKDDFINGSKKNKNKNKNEKKKKKLKLKKVKGMTNETMKDDANVTLKHLVKREANFLNSTQSLNVERLLVDGGSIFFNINDTEDVTTGNSSFSSSEEFLRQCSDTIISIDLSPFPDCNQRAIGLNDSSITWKFRANDTDFYYFIFTSDNSLEANIISFRVLLERRLYNVSTSIDSCSNSSECVFPFSFMRSEGVVVDFSERNNMSNLDDLNNYEVTTICQPRTVVYTVFILLVPFIIILFAFR